MIYVCVRCSCHGLNTGNNKENTRNNECNEGNNTKIIFEFFLNLDLPFGFLKI